MGKKWRWVPAGTTAILTIAISGLLVRSGENPAHAQGDWGSVYQMTSFLCRAVCTYCDHDTRTPNERKFLCGQACEETVSRRVRATCSARCPGSTRPGVHDGRCSACVEVALLRPWWEAHQQEYCPKSLARPAAVQNVRREIEWIPSRHAKVSFTKTEVTVAQWKACVDAGVCGRGQAKWHASCNLVLSGRDEHPVNCVELRDAYQFCRWVGGRLPSTDEWVAEATAGGSRTFPWGEKEPSCARVVMNNGCGSEGTSPVCSKSAGASDSGLCDMSGNVWEWLWEGSFKVASCQGGSWADEAPGQFTKLPSRYPNRATTSLGFRCVR